MKKAKVLLLSDGTPNWQKDGRQWALSLPDGTAFQAVVGGNCFLHQYRDFTRLSSKLFKCADTDDDELAMDKLNRHVADFLIRHRFAQEPGLEYA